MDPRQPPATEEPPPKPQSWTNAIASFMRRHHIHASRGEWYHIHRSHRFGRGPGGGWGLLVVIIGLVWLAYQVFLWLVGIIRAIIQGIAEFLTTIAPILVLIIIAGIVAAFKRRRR